MNDLAEKLLAAIAAKETLALATSGLNWRTHDGAIDSGGHCATILNEHEKPLVAWLPTFQFPGWDVPGPWANARFIADNDPASVLRRCAADRELVAFCSTTVDRYAELLADGRPEYKDLTGEVSMAQIVLTRLARGYGLEVEQPVEVVELAADGPLAQRMEQDGRQSGVDTSGCDCGHPGMGCGWHSSDCAWKRSTGLEVEQ